MVYESSPSSSPLPPPCQGCQMTKLHPINPHLILHYLSLCPVETHFHCLVGHMPNKSKMMIIWRVHNGHGAARLATLLPTPSGAEYLFFSFLFCLAGWLVSFFLSLSLVGRKGAFNFQPFLSSPLSQFFFLLYRKKHTHTWWIEKKKFLYPSTSRKRSLVASEKKVMLQWAPVIHGQAPSEHI